MRRILSILVLMAFFSVAFVNAEANAQPKSILVLNSYHPGYVWGDSVMRGVRKVLGGLGEGLKIRYEFMDTKHYPVSTIFDSLRELYRLKYQHVQFNVIIALDNNALDFLLAYRDELFPGTPVVFCGINGFTDEMIAGHSGFTGVAEDYEVRDNITLALKLHPETEHIAIVSGVSTSSLINQRRVREAIPEFSDRVDFIDLSAKNIPELTQALKALPDKTLILYISYYMTPDGTTLTVPESTSLISRTSGLPMYSPWEYTLGNGVIGGKMLSGEDQGRTAASIARRILNGEPVASIPVNRSLENQYIFDFSMLKQFNIAHSTLPKGSIIKNEPQTFYYRNKMVVWLTTGFIVYQFLTIVFLLRIIARKKKAEVSLKREEARLEALLEISQMQNAPVEEIMRFALRKAVELTGSSVGYLVQMDKAETRFVYALEDGRIELHEWDFETIDDLPESWRRATQQNTPLTVNEPGKLDWTDSQWPGASVPITSYLILPVSDGGRLIGLSIVCNKPSRFKDADLRQLTLLVEGMLRPIQHKRAEMREKHLEEELRHAQKMEAIGTFAGGIAHDFNNILGAITTCSEIALEDVPKSDPVHEDLKHVLKAAQRGKNLIARILAFSRRSDPTSQPVQLKMILSECLALLKTFIPPSIEVTLDIRTKSALVLADPTQIHQVIMNLCINAEQAMRGQKGNLHLSLNAVDLSESEVKAFPGLKPGRYARISVSDTGRGMDEKVMQRIFDPFFSTRKKSGGTGLGLSMSHGIVKRHGGAFSVESTPGKGSTFHVLLPCAHAEETAESLAQARELRGGAETILLADDDGDMAYSVERLLHKMGYNVQTCSDGAKALALLKDNPTRFDLVVTDYMMPAMTGVELAREIREMNDTMPVILYTGFEDDNVSQMSSKELKENGIDIFLTKPFAIEELCRAVRSLLDEH